MYLFNLKQVIKQYTNDVRDNYRQKLIKDNRIASGKLINDIDFKVLETDDDITVYMLLSDYWFEIEYGRKPTVNDGDGNLQIKIAEWIRQKNIQPHPDANGKLPTQKQLAYLITRKIHNEGYQGGDKDTGKGYLQSVLDGLAPYYIDKMSDALQKDIDEEVEIEVNKILRENLRFM